MLAQDTCRASSHFRRLETPGGKWHTRLLAIDPTLFAQGGVVIAGSR
jgi:hypothetical protein